MHTESGNTMTNEARSSNSWTQRRRLTHLSPRTNGREEFLKCYSESRCEPAERDYPNIALSAFDAADVIPMQASSGGKLLLRYAEGGSQFAHSTPDDLRQVHTGIVGT
jgi:hypothetical protein